MATTRIARRNLKSLPQIEATMLIEGVTSPIIACTANRDFIIGNAQIKEGEKFYLVRSARRENRYYVVHYNNIRNAYQCSCGCNMCDHDHLLTVRQYVMDNISTKKTMPVIKETTKDEAPAEETKTSVAMPQKRAENDENSIALDVTVKSTAEQWRKIAKQDKARQRAWRQEYRDEAEALREASVA